MTDAIVDEVDKFARLFKNFGTLMSRLSKVKDLAVPATTEFIANY